MGLELDGRSVVVTGGSGFLGRFVCSAMDARGAKVHALGRRAYDLTDQAEVRRLYANLKPSIVIHAAAAVGGIGANVANPGRFLYENGLMGLMLIDEARQAEIDRFVLISTTCAYPQDAPLPLREENMWDGPPTGSTGPYGMAKRLLHEACATYEAQYGLRSSVVVLANLYGPEDHFDVGTSHVVPALIRRYVVAKEAGAAAVTNWGSGNATRDFLHVRDAAEGIVLAAETDVDPHPINLGAGQETSIRDLAQLVAQAVGYDGETRWDTGKPDGQPRRFLDVSRSATQLGFAAKIPLSLGVAETVEWYLANRSDGGPT